MEQAYEQCDALLKPIEEIVKQSRDVLKGVYRGEPRKMSKFGFDVVISSTTKKKAA